MPKSPDEAADRAEPPYRRIVREITGRIAAGQLGAGDRVPSARQITQEWGVAIATATRVLATLRQAGLVRAVPGIGTVVVPAVPETRAAPPTPTPRSVRRDARAPDQDITPQGLVRTAIEMADADGIAALSMRRLAAQFGVATMSLYRHVHSKDDLVLKMADAALGEEVLPDAPALGWRARLEVEARLQWVIYQRHPWLAHVISMTRPQLLPNGIAHTEWTLRTLDGLGLDASTMLHAAITLIGYVRGSAMNFEVEAQAEQDTGLTDDQWMSTQEPTFAALFASRHYDTLARVTAAPAVALDLHTLFEFGLQRLLDGYAICIQAAARERDAPARG